MDEFCHGENRKHANVNLLCVNGAIYFCHFNFANGHFLQNPTSAWGTQHLKCSRILLKSQHWRVGLAYTNKLYFCCTYCNVADGTPEERQPLLRVRRVVERLTSIRVLTFTLLALTVIGVAGVGLWLLIGRPADLQYVFARSLSAWLLTLTFILLMWNIWWAANNASTTSV
jgi:hypothetical protein